MIYVQCEFENKTEIEIIIYRQINATVEKKTFSFNITEVFQQLCET